MVHYLIFDIGGSSIKYAVGDTDGKLCGKGKTDSSGDNLGEFIDYLKHVYDMYRTDYNLIGIAVSSPGFVDTDTGIVRGLSALPFIHNFPFAKFISESMDDLPVYIENDGNCGALGEYFKGGWGGLKSLAMLVCGSGIGGGYVYQGKILRTSHFAPSEFGFMPIAGEDGRIMPWSHYSVVNITKRYNEETGSSISAKELFDKGAADEVAYRYTEQFYHYMAVGSFCVGFALDPDIIVISGAISVRNDFGERLHLKVQNLKEQSKESAAFPSRIEVSRIGNDANLYGALYHALLITSKKEEIQI